ncbi:MAG TPA: hypothetical protein VNA25_24900 [Phycisphaerae bacterium]|nr:hypothetical protein [Phycisphaerae bacterium]
MESVNAIAKVRFGSAKPQRVQLRKDAHASIELLCMEPGQKHKVASGRWAYYIVTGAASFAGKDSQADLATGQLAVTEPGETHTICTAGEHRLVCLAVKCG